MLLGSIFQINSIQHQDNTDVVSISFNPTHEIFKGHFPHLPVVPGVCQIQILEEVISEISGKPYTMKEAGQIKFLALLNPLKSPEITLEIKRETSNDNSTSVTARYFNDAETFFRFKGLLHA